MVERPIALTLLICLTWFVTLYVNPLTDNAFEAGKVIIFLLGSVVLLATQLILNRDVLPQLATHLRNHPLFWPLILLIAVNLIAALAAEDVGQSLFRIDSYRGASINIASYIFCLVAISILGSSKRNMLLIIALLVCSIPVTIYGWLQYLSLDPVQWQSVSVSDVQSTLGRSIYLGAYLAMILPFTLQAGLRKDNSNGQRIVYTLLGLLQLGCLYLTLSRGAWLALLVALLLFVILYFYEQWQLLRTYKWTLLIGALALLLVGLVTIWFNFAAIGSVDQDSLLKARLEGDRGRLIAWQAIVERWPDSPIIGHGPESFATYFATYEKEGVDIRWFHRLDDPHNILFGYLDGTGIVGLALFIWLLILVGRTLYRGRQGQQPLLNGAVAAALVAFLVTSQFNPQRITLLMLFWLLVALGTTMQAEA